LRPCADSKGPTGAIGGRLARRRPSGCRRLRQERRRKLERKRKRRSGTLYSAAITKLKWRVRSLLSKLKEGDLRSSLKRSWTTNAEFSKKSR